MGTVKPHQNRKSRKSHAPLAMLVAVLIAGLMFSRACPAADGQPVPEAEAGKTQPWLEFTARYRRVFPPLPEDRTRQARVLEQSREHVWNPRQTALILVDLWDQHWCKSAMRRIEEMSPRVAELADFLREQGVLIIHAPGGTMDHYRQHPGYRMARNAPVVSTDPRLRLRWFERDRLKEPELPIDFSDGGCDDPEPGPMDRTYRKQIDLIPIEAGDAIGDDLAIFYLLRQRGIENVLILGAATNMCVLGRPYGIRQLVTQGLNVVLIRDLTDSMYNPAMPPYVSHQQGTDLVVEHIEQHWCPSITSNQLLGGEAFRFSDADAPPPQRWD